MSEFDPFKALEHQQDIRDAEKTVVADAIELIEVDRPNAAKRLLRYWIIEGRAANDIAKSKMDQAIEGDGE